ncbi:MAG: ATPase domain-containing protein [Candidatus Bathyarchaeia archaeon]
MQRIIPTGCSSLDEQLNGGLLGGTLNLLYGEAETGKTTLAIQCAVNCARMDYKTIFIDCDGTFSPKRMAQIAQGDFETLAPQIILMKPEDFDQQAAVVDRLNEYISERVGLIVVDTVNNLYRERLGDDMRRNFALNRELNRQMACLAQTTKTRKVACLVISQVRSVVFEEQESVQPVATRVLKFWADTTMTLQPTAQSTVTKAVVDTRLRKKPTKPVLFEIGERGLVDHRG